MEISRDQLLDADGKPLTQSLFLEIGYTDFALYTLKDVDHEYKGKVYPSLKRLYLELSDPTEYEFAVTYFLNWKHWQRICANALIRKHIDEWREELDMKFRSEGVKLVMKAASRGKVDAAKWIATKGWEVRPAGRPSKAEVERNIAITARAADEYSGDVIRMSDRKHG